MAIVEPVELARFMNAETSFDSTQEPRFAQAIDNALGWIEIYLGYPIQQGEHTAVLDGSGTNTIFLPRYPVSQIIKAEYLDLTETDLDVWVNYADDDVRTRFNSETGEVKLMGGIFQADMQNIRIQYTHGYDFSAASSTFTPDWRVQGVKWALSEIAVLFLNNPGLLSFNEIDQGTKKSRFNYTAGSSSVVIMSMLSPETINILHSFAKRGVAR